MKNPLFTEDRIIRAKKTKYPIKIRGEFALLKPDKGEDPILSFLFANADDMVLPMKLQDLRKIRDIETPTGRVVRFEQLQNGLRIIGTEINVRLDTSARIKQIDLGHVHNINVIKQLKDEKLLTAVDSLKVAAESIGKHTLRQKSALPEKVYFPTSKGLKLAFEVFILTSDPSHDWYLIVDAYSGEILSKQDLIWKVNGQGQVFDPNPVVTASNNTFRDPTATMPPCGFIGTAQATIDAQRVTRTLRDITSSGGKYKLDGPYVKLRDFGTPAIAPPEETNANNFTYQSNNNGFEAVMVYYHVDTLQRYIQKTLGISNANNRKTEADAHDNGVGGMAFYSPGDKGLHFGDSGPCNPDRAEDADCIYHEYNHAIMDNVVPGYGPGGVANPVTGRCESRAIGEGCGDILPCVYFAPDHPFQREIFEDWVFAPGGLRRVDGTKIYSNNWVNEEHSDGEIWSAALWNIYRANGGDAVDVATQRDARDELLKTMISSYFNLSTNPSMQDAAEAMLDTNADLREYRLRHGIEMLNSFHDRGILKCQPGSNLKIIELWSQRNESPAVSWQQVEAGQDNWFYAKVRNDGTAAARAFVVEFSFKSPFSTPVYPADFRNNIISGAVADVLELAPGATTTVKSRWPKELIPPIPTGATTRHCCLFAEVYNPVDHVAAGVTTIGASNGKLAQRNTDIVNLLPDDSMDYFFTISNYHITLTKQVKLELIRPPKWPNLEVSFHHPNREVVKTFYNRAKLDGELVTIKESLVLKFQPGLKKQWTYPMKPRERVTFKVTIKVPKEAKPGEHIKVEVFQTDRKGLFIGGFDVLINVVAKK